MTPFETKQILHALAQPGNKTQSEVDFGRKVASFINTILNLPITGAMTMDVEARKVKTKYGYEWHVGFVGSINPPIAEFGCDPASEHNARLVADLINAVTSFRQSIGV